MKAYLWKQINQPTRQQQNVINECADKEENKTKRSKI